jgi:hypothetical protein
MNESLTGDTNCMDTNPYTEFLRILSDDPSVAEDKYRELRRKLINYFRLKGFSDQETLADETFHRAVYSYAKLKEPLNSVWAWVMGIALNISREKYRERQKYDVNYNFNHHSHNLSDTDSDEDRMNCMRLCLNEFNEKDRNLLLDYYNDLVKASENRKRLAELLILCQPTLKDAQATLRQKISRLVAQLKSCTVDCIAKKGKN